MQIKLATLNRDNFFKSLNVLVQVKNKSEVKTFMKSEYENVSQ